MRYLRQRAGSGQQREPLDAQNAPSLATEPAIRAREASGISEDHEGLHDLLEIEQSHPRRVNPPD
jgi:hypothetical protein